MKHHIIVKFTDGTDVQALLAPVKPFLPKPCPSPASTGWR